MIAGFGQPGLPTGSVGFVNLIALAAITAMSILTAPLGAAAAHSLDPVKLKRVFGGYLLVTAAFMLKTHPVRRAVVAGNRPSLGLVIDELDEVHPLARPVLGNLQEIDNAREARLAGQRGCHVRQVDLLDRRHLDLAGRQGVSAARPHVRLLPDAYTARHLAALHRFAKALGELHRLLLEGLAL